MLQYDLQRLPVLLIHDCRNTTNNVPNPIASSVLCMDTSVLASTAALPCITPPAWLTTCCATSNTAIVKSNVWVISSTAIKVLKIHFQMNQVSKLARLL